MRSSDRLLVMSLISVSLLFSACDRPTKNGGTGPAHQQLVVAITPLSHPSLEQCYKGFVQGLREKGKEEPAVRVELMNANGDFASVPSLVKNAVAKEPAAIFILTTPAAKEAIKITNPAGVPLVYAAVTDPVAAKIVTSMEKSDTLATGISDRYPVEEQVRVFHMLKPSLRVGALIYNPAEDNSQILVRQTIEALKKIGVEGQRYEVHNAGEIPSQVKQALAASDCIIVNGDNLVTEHLSTVANLCRSNKKPLFVGDPDSVRKGAIATVGPSYFELGRRAGHQASQILEGSNAGTVPSEYPRSFDYIINTGASRAIGLDIPAGFWTSREIWESRSASSN